GRSRQPGARRDRHVRPRRGCPMSQIRIYCTGDCDGFEALRRALAEQPEVELVGEGEHVAQATSALAGGHLDCVLHATRSTSFPAAEVAAIREQTRVTLILLRSRGEA